MTESEKRRLKRSAAHLNAAWSHLISAGMEIRGVKLWHPYKNNVTPPVPEIVGGIFAAASVTAKVESHVTDYVGMIYDKDRLPCARTPKNPVGRLRCACCKRLRNVWKVATVLVCRRCRDGECTCHVPATP